MQNANVGVDAPTEDKKDIPLGFGPVDLTSDAGLPSTMPGDTQTVDHDASFKHHLKNFTKKVVSKRVSLLIRGPPKSPPAKAVLPWRSKRLAAQSLSLVPTSKRGEVLILQRLGLVTGLSLTSELAMKTDEVLYEAEPSASNIEALEALFQYSGKESARP